MNVIKFNNTEFEVEGYSKNTYFNGASMSSNGMCQVKLDDISALMDLAQTPITSIQILHDDVVIYDLQDINARIDNTNEYLNTDRIDVSINLIFEE